MKKTVVILMVLTMITKVFGFSRDITLSYFYGTSNISDAYLVSITIPMIIFEFIGSGIDTSYIPIYNSIVKEKSEQSAVYFTSNVLNLVLILCTLLVLLVTTFTTPIVKMSALGFKGETLQLAVQFTRVSILGVYFSGLMYVFKGYLQIRNNFVVPGLMGIPLNLFIIISIALSQGFGVMFLSLGTVVAMAFQMLFLIPFAYRQGFTYTFILNMKDNYLSKMVRLSGPVILGVSVNQINVLVNQTIASQIAVGGVSALTYANRINLFIQGIFVLSLTTVLYPSISKMASDDNIDGFKQSVLHAINSISILVVPTTIGFMLFSEPIVRLLFGRGAFESEAISMTSNALFFLSMGMVGFGLREILARAFYSLQDTKTPMMNAAVAMGLNAILSITLAKTLGIGGLALATSISAIGCTILLFISLRKKIGSFGIKSILSTFIKILSASLIMGFLAKLLYNVLVEAVGMYLSLIISVVIGGILYLVIVHAMKINEIEDIVKGIKRHFRSRNYFSSCIDKV